LYTVIWHLSFWQILLHQLWPFPRPWFLPVYGYMENKEMNEWMSYPLLQFSKAYKPIWDFNLILFPNLKLTDIPEIVCPHQMSVLILTYCHCFPNSCNHHTVISITVSSTERSYIGSTWMLSPIYQYVSLPIRRGPAVLMNVSVREHHALNNYIFWCGKVYFSNTIIITILM